MRSNFLNIVKYKLITFEHFFKKSAVVRVCSLFIFSFIFQNNILAQNANITISTGTETGVSWTGAGTDASPWVLVPTAQSVTINITNLKAKLANSNVTINTAYASGTTGPTIGTVTFSNELIDSSSSSTTKTLTINANSDIIINANIIMSTNYNLNNHTFLPKALNFISTNGSITINAIIKTIPSNLFAANGLDITGKTAGAVSLTTNGTSGAIKVLSSGQILTNGQYNASTTTNSWGGNGGAISLIANGSSGGVSVAGKISTSAGKRANGGDVDFKFTLPGNYNITTNNTAVTAGINDGQVNTTVDSIGSFTKDGAGIYQIKRTVFGGTADIGYDLLSPKFKILNGTIKLVGSANAHFSDFADFDIASTGTLELNGISETIGSITGAGKINTVSTPASAHTLTLTYSNPFKTQLIATNDALKAGLVFSGVITGNLTLIKTYPDFGSIYNQKDEHGTLILTNTSNNYTGKTILRAGRLFVNANALGVNSSISDSVVIEKFGTLLLYGGVQLNKKISIKGNGEFGTGAILDSTGLNKIIGTIKLDSAATIGTISTNINLSTDSLELGAINTSTFELTIRNNLGVHAKGIISGTGTSSLTKTGNQVLKLGGVNDYTGFTKITSGSILLGAADRISSNSDLQLNGGDFNTNNFNETLRKIFILNSGSTITLGNGAVAHNLTFGFSDSAYVANYIKVVNWAGSFLNDGTTGTGGDIIFTKKQINSQLDNFRFEKTGDPVLYKARQINNGANFEIVPGSNTLSNHANINIVTTTTSGTSVSVGGSWTGSGTALSPHTFTLNAESAEIVISEIVSKLQSSDGNSNVLIKTDYTGSNQSGTIFLSGAISANNNITSNQNTFTFTAKNTINLNSAITLTSSGYSASTVAYPVTNLNFNADTAINVNANIIASATNMTNYAYKSANGGSVVFNLANNKGVFSLANTISIISAGSNNTHASAFGGDGGNVSITANGGITINGNINLPNGASLASPTFLNTRPGTLTVATENATITSSGVNDGQNATSTFSIGNFIKNGTGFFKLNNAKWVGGNSAPLKEFNTPNHQINAGRLQLSSNTSISDSASIAINTGAILDLASYGETLGNISGAGLITTSSGTPTLILTSNSVDNTTTTKFSKFEFSGKLSGAFAIQKNGNDTLILSGDNLSSVATPSHSGAFEVKGGVIIAKSTETLGTTSSITTLNGGTVVLDMQGSTISEPFTFANGEGISTEGALKLLSTSTGNTINGAMIVNTNATTRINTNAPLTLSSSVSFNSGAILKLGGTGTITMTSLLSSVAASNGTLQQENPLLVLSGNSSSFTGNFNNPTSGNTTLLQNANGLGNTGTATIVSGALLKVDGTGFSIAKALNLNGTGISTSGVLWNTGTTNTFTGAVTLANNSTINTDASTTLTMSGAIGGGFGITKIGTGTLSLGGTNGFTGNSTISNGTVVVTNISGLGPTGSTTISNGAMVRISVAGTITEPFSIIGTGIDNAGVIQNTINGTTISGAITLAGNSTINTDASTTLTLSGLIGGTGFGITKIGTGTISLGNANTFTGNNTISNGLVEVTNANGLGGNTVGASGTTTVSSNAMVKFLTTTNMSVPEAFNITGTGISNVGVIQNSVSGTTLSGAITLAGTSMIRTDLSTTLTISNTTDGLNMGANELNIGGNGTIVVSGKLTGSNSTTSIFRKDGIGTLTLSNDNGTSFTGPIVINAGGGILAATHANALGTTGAGTTVNNQSSLQLGVTNIAEPVNIRGHGYGSTTATIATTGALYTSAATFTYKGVLTLDSIATIASVTSGTLTMDAAPGSIVMNDKVLHINGAGNFLINSVITGSATLNKWGVGTTTLSGNNGTSFTGPIVVNAGGGILAATHANALGTTAAGTTVFNQASIQLGVTDISEPISIRGHGNGQTSTVASIGALYTSAASYTYKGVLTVDSTATIASVTSGQTLTFDNTTNAIISNNTAGGLGYTINGAGNVSITGKLSGIGSLTKSGIGTTLLSLDNSTGAAYNATTNVNDGILRITDGNALGTSTSNTIVSSTGSVQLENNITVLETFTIASTNANGAIRNQSGKNTLQGLITLSGTASIITHNATTGVLNDSLFITGGINLGANALTLTPNNQGMRISNNLIYGSGTLTKNGADTLVLLNANTYTGNTTVSAGKIILKDKDALGNNGTTYGITTLSGGTVVLDMQNSTIAEPFTFATGEGIGTDGALKLIATSTGNTINGAMIVNTSAITRINTYAPLTISSGLTLNGSATLKLGGTATITMSSIIAAGTGVLQQENPLLVLSGNSSSYTGNFNNPTSGNTTLLQNANGLGSSGTATIGSGALLKIEGTGFSIGKALNLNGTGISTSGVLWNTGTANTFTGAVTLAGNSTINTDASTTLTISGAIGGGFGITKIGTGTLSLGGTNGFTGNSTISNGTVVVTNISGLGPTGSTTISDGAMVKISVAGTVPEPFSIIGTGIDNAGVIQNTVNGTTISGAITLAGNSTINTDASTTLTLSGVIGGTGFGITKIGSGNLSLGGANTFTGNNTISAGAAIVTNASGLGGNVVGSSGTTTVSNNAMVQFLTTGSMSVPEAFNIIGTGVSNVGVLQNSVNGTNLTGAITLAGLSMIRADNGMGLTISNTLGGLDMGANELNIGGAGTITFSGKLTGSNSTTSIFRKDGTGTLTLSNDNGTSFTGPIVVNAGGGILAATHANALGTTAAGTTVFNQGSLQLGVTNIAEPINIRGHGYGQASTVATIGALYTSAATFTYKGVLTVDSTATIASVTSGTLTFDNTTDAIISNNTLGGSGYTINGAGNISVTGKLSGIGSLTKSGTGTTLLSLDNSTGTAYAAETYVNNGILRITNGNALGTSSNNTVVSATGSVQLENNINVLETFTITSTNANGAIRNQSGKNTLQGLITLSGAASIITHTTGTALTDSLYITGGINIGANALTLTTNNQGMRISNNAIYGSGTLTKNGTDTLVLLNANTYTGNTTLSTGKIIIKDKDALGNTGGIYGITTVNAGTTLQIVGNGLNIAEPITLNGDGLAANQGALKNNSQTNIVSGAITIGSSGARIVSTGVALDGSDLLTLSGLMTLNGLLTIDVTKGINISNVISGVGGITKIGNDTLIVGGANFYTGATIISNGVLQLQNQDGLGSTSPGGSSTTASTTTVASGAAIKIVGSGFVIPETLSLSGTGFNSRGVIYNQANTNTLSGIITIAADASFSSDGTNSNDELRVTGTINTGASIISSGLVLNLDAGNALSYTSGNIWNDLSTSRNNAILMNSPTFDAANGGSISFNGTTQYATLDPAKLVTGNTISIGFWNNGGTAQGSSIFGGLNSGARSYNIHLPWVDKIVYWDAGSGNGAYDRIQTAVLADADFQGWHYWVFTKDVVAGTMAIYKDGVSIASGTSMVRALPTVTTATIGSEGSNYHNGKIGVVQMYNKVLSTSEIEQNYNANAIRFGRSTIGSGSGQSAATLTINSIKAVRISGVISGSGAIIKTGSDTLVLTGVNTYKGITRVNAGTLKLGATNVIDNEADLYLNGGNLSTNYDETIRKLYLTNDSRITLGQTSHTLTFSDVDSLLNKKKLIISGWAGAYTGTGTGANGKIIFTADTLLDYQLDQINFINASGTSFFSTQNLSSSTEIIPIGTEATTITGYSNVFITTEATNLSNGAWSGDGSVLNPYTFTPLANDANVGASDIQTKLGTGAGNVKILTSLTNGQGNQTGTIIINAPITYANAGNITKTFYITANSNVVVYKNIELKASTHSSGNANKVVNLELNSITKDVVLQASLLSSANYATNLSINDTASNGGNISLKSDAGKIRIYSNGAIESKGGNASSTTAIGGNGGNVILDGYNGVSIFGSIDLSNGFFGNSLTNANLFKAFPGSLTIINQDNGLFDLQAVNSIKVGNITKDGAGNFGITNTKWGGYVVPSGSALNAYTPQIKIINGNLILNSTTSIQDSADIEIQSNGKLDLNAKGETVGSISGAGQIINSSSTNAILTLNYFNSEKLTTTFSGSIKNNISIDKKGSSRKLILSGDNSYSGTTTVSNGTLNIQSENALGTFTGASDNTTVVNAATLELESGKSFNAESITFNAGASLINVSGQNILNGPLTNLGTATFTCSADSLEIENSTLALGGLLTINGNARISSVISGAGGITKSGASSTLILNGNNTYQGTTTINSGSVVKVGHNNALGQFNMTTFTSSHTQVATGGTLWVDGTGINISEETRVNGDGITISGGVKLGAIYNQKGANKFTGKISLETDARIFSDGVSAAPIRDSLVFEMVGIDLNNKILSFVTTSAIRNSRPILSSTTATGSIIKLGVDSLLLNAATESSYTGYTKVSEGGIVLGAANQINNASSLFLDGGYFNTGGYAETLGKLFLTNNSNLILGNTNHILTFASVDSLLNKKSLNIYGWLGDYTAATNEGTNGKILIQNSTLLPYQLDQINFIDIENSNAVNYSTQLITKYLIPKGDILSNPTYQSNIIINSEATDLTKGGWTGDGSSGNPWTFTPIANDANIQTTDIQAKLISGNNVIIKTTRASGGNQSGSIIIKDKISVDNTSLLSVGTLKLLAKRNITLYGNIEHTSTSTSTIIRPVPSIEFISDSGDINLYAAIKTTPKDIGYSAGQAANGGNISLNAIATTGTEGRIFIESNTLAFIEAKGANNTSAGASTKGGNGGDITLNGISGVNIYSFINTANGYRNASASDFTLSKPGKLTVNTNSTVLSSRVNEGQTSTSNMYIGDFEKTGTGKFNIYSIRRSNAGASLPAIVDNESNFSISGGTVLLTSSNSISDSANIALSNTGILDLNGYDETVGTYSGTVNTSITSTPSLKTLTTKSINSIAIKAIFDGSLGNINFIKETGSTDTTVLTKNNLATYLGKTTIRAGAIILQNDNALGAYNTPATNNTEISGTGSVQLENNISVLEPFTIASTSSNGAIRNQNGKNNLQGLITLSGTASIITHNATTGVLNDSLFITGGINIGANALTLTPNNQGMRISNTAIYGTGTITKSGADTLVLQNANTYTGNTTVNAGKLIIKDKDALGNNGTTYAITTLSGGTVVLDMETSTIAEPFTFATGEGIATDGALKLIETSTGNTISGAMVVNGNATTRINTYAPLTLSSSVSFNSGAILKLGGTGTITMTSLLSSVAATNGTLQQENPLLVLSGNSSSYTGNFNNPNTGNTTSLQNANGLGGTVVGSSGTATIGTGALLKIDGTGYSIAKALNLNGTGISNSGVLWNTGTSNTFAGAVTLAANSMMNVDASTTLTMSGVIGGTGFGITKIGSGILSLGGTNTFTGNNTISNGTVVVTNINGLGGSGVGSSGTTTVSDGAMVRISVAGTLPEAFNIIGTGISSNGVLQNTVTGAIISGIITLAGNSTINTDASTTLTISGAIGGTGFGITKIGSGNLSLGGTNTFTGDNTISAGRAIVTNASGLGGSVVGTSGTTTVSNNAMVQFLTTGSMSVPEAFNIIGTGISNVGVLQNSVNGTNLTGAITLAGLSMIRTDASTTLTISNTTDGLGMDVNELNIGGAGTINFSGKLTGSNSTTSIFRKDGTGTLTLSNDNGTSFTGPIIVNAGGGILAATHANALGTTAAGTTVFNQSSLQLGVTSIAEPVNIRGHGYGKTSTDGTIGALFASDNFTYSGLLTVDSTATLSSATASKVLTIDAPGSIVMNDKVLNINGAGNFIINSTIAGSTTLNKWGIGTTTLSGDNGSSYTGPIVVNAGSGILLANHVNALGSTGAGTTVYNQGSLQIAVTDIAEPINIRGHGYGQTSTVATIGAFYTSDSYTYKGVLTMDSTATIASVTAARMLTLDNTTSAIVSNNTAGGTGYTINGAGDVSITGKLTGIGSLTKSGTGTTTLSYDNSTGTAYDAVTNVIDGILRITDGKALGTSTSTKHTVVSGTGSVQLENNITVLEPFTITSSSTNGAIRNQSGKNTLQGLITLNAAGTSKIISAGVDNINDSLFITTGGINTGSLATTYVGLETLKGMRITGSISGSGGFTKSGADTLLLYNTNGNTFAGIATLSDGIVRINNKSALGDSANTITTNYTQINSGATLFIDFKDVVLKESFIINGIGEIISGDTLGPIKTREGRNYLSGTIKVNSNSFINTGIDFVKNINTDSLIFNLINTDSELTIKTNIGTRVIGGISGNGSIVKVGMDTLIYTGANTYKGYTKISEGCLLLGATNIMPNTNSGNELIFNGGTLSSGGKENNFGRLSITENSKINLRFVDVHKLTFSTGGSYKSGKKVVIYGWSGLTGGVVTPAGKIESTNVLQLSVYLRSSGKTDKSKSGGVQASGQIVSTALGVDFNGRIYMNSSPQLTQFQRDRIRFYYDKNEIEYSATQAAGGELLAENPIAIEPSTAFVGSTLTTTAISSPTNVSATSGGNITAALNDSVLVRGVVWSTSSNPTVDLTTKTIDGSGKGSFTSNLTELTAGTLYYVRAYAINSNSTDYGTQVSFTTQTPPTLTATTTPSSVTAWSATSGGNISSANGFTMVTRGVVWSTSANPTIALSTKTAEASTAIGSFTANLTGLTANTTYFIRSYATNTSGTDYGPQTTFTTLTAPTGTQADPISNLSQTLSAGTYYFAPPGATDATIQLYYEPNFRGTGFGFVRVFSSPTGANATVNHIDKNLPITEFMVNNVGSASNWATAGWNNGYRRFNTRNQTDDLTTLATSTRVGFRVFFGYGGGHGIYSTSQGVCNWGSAVNAIGAGYNGSCGSFPNNLIWGTGPNTAYSNVVANSVWEIWIRW